MGVRHLRPQRDLHRVGELLHAREDRRSALGTELDLLCSIVPDLLVRLRIRGTAQRRYKLLRGTPSVRRRDDMHACVGQWPYCAIAIWSCTPQAYETERSWRRSLPENRAHEDEGGTEQCRFAALASALPTLCMASAGPNRSASWSARPPAKKQRGELQGSCRVSLWPD